MSTARPAVVHGTGGGAACPSPAASDPRCVHNGGDPPRRAADRHPGTACRPRGPPLCTAPAAGRPVRHPRGSRPAVRAQRRRSSTTRRGPASGDGVSTTRPAVVHGTGGGAACPSPAASDPPTPLRASGDTPQLIEQEQRDLGAVPGRPPLLASDGSDRAACRGSEPHPREHTVSPCPSRPPPRAGGTERCPGHRERARGAEGGVRGPRGRGRPGPLRRARRHRDPRPENRCRWTRGGCPRAGCRCRRRGSPPGRRPLRSPG